MARVFAFGSSTTYGLSDHEFGGWVSRLKTTMIERAEEDGQQFVPVYNFGVAGQLIAKTVKRFEIDVGSYIEFPGRDIAIFALGSLDSAQRHLSDEPITPLDEFTKLLPKLGELCVSIAESRHKEPIRPFFLGLTPVDDDHAITRRVPDRFSNEYRAAYQAEVRSYAMREGYPFIETMAPMLLKHHSSEGGVIGGDGVHPNELGHAILHDLVMNAVGDYVFESTEAVAIA